MTKPISPLRQRMIDDMTMRNLSPSTHETYIRAVAQFSAFHRRSPDKLGVEHLREYHLHLVSRGLTANSICVKMSALRFFYGTTLRRPDIAGQIPMPRRTDHLPTVLAREEVEHLLNAVPDLKLRTALITIYSAGLRGPLDTMRRIGDTEVERIIARMQRERPGLPQPRGPLRDYQNFYRHVLFDDVGSVKVITIRRPDALNAINDEVTDEILAAIRRFEGDEAVHGFVLTGYGARAFSAGADIGRFPGVLGNAEGQRLSSEAIGILDAAIRDAAAAPTFAAALEIGYRAFGTSARTAAAREGIDAFLQRRPADFSKTG